MINGRSKVVSVEARKKRLAEILKTSRPRRRPEADALPVEPSPVPRPLEPALAEVPE
jgi:hypothetical protein